MATPAPAIPEPTSSPEGWLNRTTLGISLASLLSDVSHELATAVLPAFLMSLGAGASTACGIVTARATTSSSLTPETTEQGSPKC